MAGLERSDCWKSFGGTQQVWRHASRATGTEMTFALYLPEGDGPWPLLWYLSGLTCSHKNVMEKGGYQQLCAELGLALVAPDTSPRGDGVPGDPDGGWDFGLGAGFYVDATRAPWRQHYRMWSYVTDELPGLLGAAFPLDMARQGMLGHSMGGHGALTIGLTYPKRFRSVSAFAPIVAPSKVPWGEKAFGRFFGDDRALWRRHDAVALIEDGARVAALRVDQGTADPFLEEQLQTDRLLAACTAAGIPLELGMRDGYDHSYYFIATFMADHLRWHAARLRA